MIVELYEDRGTIDKEGEKVPYVNDAHRWWVRFSNGARRPATDTELELWQLMLEQRQNYEQACKNFWETYAAAMGLPDGATFDGVRTTDPVEDVRQERQHLINRGRNSIMGDRET